MDRNGHPDHVGRENDGTPKNRADHAGHGSASHRKAGTRRLITMRTMIALTTVRALRAIPMAISCANLVSSARLIGSSICAALPSG